MSTKQQLIKAFIYKYKLKRKFKRLPLREGPHRKSVAFKITTRKPKKPNSANRPVIGTLIKRGHIIYTHIPGTGGHTLQKFSTFLIQGSRVRDLPQVQYRGIRGVLDLKYVADRMTSRSKYGRKNPYRIAVIKKLSKKKTVRRDKQIAASAAKVTS